MTAPTQRRGIESVHIAGPRRTGRDTLVTEEPLEIRVNGRRYAVTMRTPGHDVELVAGFLVSEGIATQPEDIAGIRYCVDETPFAENTLNVMEATVRGAGGVRAAARQRTTVTSSACGVCGLDSIDAVETTSSFDVAADPVTVDGALLASLPERLRRDQRLFETTGGLHAAGLFDTTGSPLVVREDVGRHNAVDKVIGHAYTRGELPLRGRVLQVSGRASFELVQKAAMAGVPVLAAVSAPSSLAVDLAERLGITLAGFSRGETFNLYTRPDRVV